MKKLLIIAISFSAIMSVVTSLALYSPSGRAHTDAMRVGAKIASEVRKGVPDKSAFLSLRQDDKAFDFNGKVVVLDTEDEPRGRMEIGVQIQLPDEFRAHSQDYDAKRAVTVFVVGDNYAKEAVGAYGGGTFTAHKISADVYALSWPDMVPIGKTRLEHEPNSTTVYKPEPEKRFNEMIASWVRSHHVR